MASLKRSEKIFVNRSLNMASIKSIGFDMDHTLARYYREAFESLAFRKTLEKFIAAGYPQELAELSFDPKFVIRGLLVDMDRGNLLKVDGHKYVKVAYHGHSKLDKSVRHRLYNSSGYKADEFLSIDTFFALSEVQLFTEIIDYMRRNPGSIKKSFREVYRDLREFIDLSHRDGSIKDVVLSDIGQYIVKDKSIAPTLAKLIEGGKKLFLLTNSDWTYTDTIMSFLLNDSLEEYPRWQDYFDYTIVSSGKPNFFTGSNPFYEVVNKEGLLRLHNGSLAVGGLYHGGNAKLFERLTNQRGDQILYVGDHIFGDIMRSKELFNWRTLLVVEELEDEFSVIEDQKSDLARIMVQIRNDEKLSLEAFSLRGKIFNLQRRRKYRKNDRQKLEKLERKIDDAKDALRKVETQLEDSHKDIHKKIKARESVFHPVWGELMYTSLEKSRFAKQVEAYACLYTTKITNLLFYSANQNFRSFRDNMPHDV